MSRMGGRDFFFELDRIFIAQRGVFSELVIKYLDILAGIAAGSRFIEEYFISDGRGFVSAVNGYLCGVILAIALRDHALFDPKAPEHGLIVIAGVSTAPVAVVNQALRQLSPPHQHGKLQSLADQL